MTPERFSELCIRSLKRDGEAVQVCSQLPVRFHVDLMHSEVRFRISRGTHIGALLHREPIFNQSVDGAIRRGAPRAMETVTVILVAGIDGVIDESE